MERKNDIPELVISDGIPQLLGWEIHITTTSNPRELLYVAIDPQNSNKAIVYRMNVTQPSVDGDPIFTLRRHERASGKRLLVDEE